MTSMTTKDAANTSTSSSSSGSLTSDKRTETATSSTTSTLVSASTSTEVSQPVSSYTSILNAKQTPLIIDASSTLRTNSTHLVSNLTDPTSNSNSPGTSIESTLTISNMTVRTTETTPNQSTTNFNTDMNKSTVFNTSTELPTIHSNVTQSGSNSTRDYVSISDDSSNVTIKTSTTFEPDVQERTKLASATDNGNQNQPRVVVPSTYTHRINKTSVSDFTTQPPVTFLSSSSISSATDAPTHVNQSMPDLNPTIPADCSSVIGLSIGISVMVWVLTVLCFLVILLRMRHRWKRKLREERQRTDIWSLSTYHNTIINENFLDYKLAPSSDLYRRSDGKSYNKNTAKLKQGRLSSGALSGRSSASYNDDFSFRQSFIRRETMNNDDRFRFKRSRSRLKRQPSSHSSDYFLQEQNPEIRPRTSTFNIGKRDKNDKHVLLNHDMLHLTGSRSLDNLEMLEIRSRNNSLSSSQNQPFYVTEL